MSKTKNKDIDRAEYLEWEQHQRELNGREPLLSDMEMTALAIIVHPSRKFHTHENPHTTARRIRGFYEAKITSGDLMVVKTVKLSEYAVRLGIRTGTIITACCGKEVFVCGVHIEDGMFGGAEYCPGCGAKIITP